MLSVMLALAAASGSPSLSAEQLVAKNLEARGGAAALAAIKSVEFDGMLRTPGDFELTLKQVQKRQARGDAIRVELVAQGMTVLQVYDGAHGWRVNPFQGRRDAETMTSDDARSLADQGLIDGPLLASAANGSKVVALGREDFDGTDAYKLRVSQPDGDEFTYYLDPDTFLEIKMVESRRLRGALTVTDYEFGDYEKVAGVYFPMSIDNWTDGQPNARSRVTFDKATANVDIADSAFAQPADTPSSAPKEEKR